MGWILRQFVRHVREATPSTRMGVIGATNQHLNIGRRAPVSVIHWRSRKLPRKAGSPQLVETYAGSYTVVEMAWIKALWESMSWTDYNILTQRRDSAPSRELVMPYVVRDENPSYTDPESVLIMDSKGLHDSLDNELPQDDRKSALETPIISEFLKRIAGRARWVPHNYNPADAMTKMKDAHCQPLYDLLKSGMFTLRGEREELEDRKKQKEKGTLPRLKINALSKSKVMPPAGSRDQSGSEFFVSTKKTFFHMICG